MSLLTNVEILEDALIIDEADDLREELINNIEGTEVPSTHVKCEGMLVHKASLLKHTMSGSTFPKSLDRTKRAAGFSRCKHVNLTAVPRATDNTFIDDNGMSMHVSEGDSVAFIGKCKNSIDNHK